MLEHILNALFPKRCVGCRRIGTYYCDSCFTTISIYTSYVCPICLHPSIDGFTHHKCTNLYRIDGLFCGFVYSGVVKRLLIQFKYKPYLSALTKDLGELLCDVLAQNELFVNILKENPVVTAVPLSSQKERSRGYNHAALLSSYVAQYFHLRGDDRSLIRVRNTKPQFQLNPTARLHNIKNAFAINEKKKNLIKGKVILLVDDISTTCTTLRECAKVLKRNDAKKVYGVTFAKEL